MPIERDRILAPRGISRLPTPVGDYDAATKKYVDDNIGGGGAVATDAIWDVKGDIAAGTGANTADNLAVGADGEVLTADSSTLTGLKWAAAAGGGGNAVAVAVDFGASFTHFAETVVTGQAWVTPTSAIVATPVASAGEVEETVLFQFSPTVSARVAGTGFTLSVYAPVEAKGSYTFACVGV